MHDFEAAMPIYGLSFSNKPFQTGQGVPSVLMGVGSYMQSHNRIQILSMNEATGMRKELEIDEPWPATKIMWLPPSEGLISSERDIFATSSDILRIYTIDRDRAGV